MKSFPVIAIVLFFLFACENYQNAQQINSNTSDVKKVIVEEAIQTSNYTYLRVKEGDKEQWLAVPKIQAASGDVFYYKGGMPMSSFESKELKRTFESILFLDQISSTPEITKTEASTVPQGIQDPASSNLHKVVVEEVLQTTNYTYLRVKEGEIEQWLALPKMQASVGEVYYHEGGLAMKDFTSKELNRIFKEVFFLDYVRSAQEVAIKENPGGSPHGSNPHDGSNPHGSNPPAATKGSTATAPDKKEIKIDPAKGGITIGELLKNKKSYAGKKIKIKGQVTKFSPYIMDKNWIHIQDGTETSGKFDLTATTNIEVKVGDIITIEGVIALDKDFGFGYLYEVLMEDAQIVN